MAIIGGVLQVSSRDYCSYPPLCNFWCKKRESKPTCRGREGSYRGSFFLIQLFRVNVFCVLNLFAAMAEDEEGRMSFSSLEEELEYWKEKAIEYRDK